jgi:hypothetical protein
VQRKVATAAAIGGAAFGGFLAGAFLLTLLDLFLAGHSIEPLGNRRLLDVDRLGIHLSVADGLALGLALIAATAAGFAVRWLRPR